MVVSRGQPLSLGGKSLVKCNSASADSACGSGMRASVLPQIAHTFVVRIFFKQQVAIAAMY